jgi:hypothetical protein
MSEVDPHLIAAARAKRDLHREEMVRFGHELTWLAEPSEIPEGAISRDGTVPQQCSDLAFWMLNQLNVWSGQGHSRLSIGETFEKYELPNDWRVSVRGYFQRHAFAAYTPGVTAMAEIFAVVPSIAKREGVDQDEWAEIAGRSSKFGEEMARHGTNAQALLRDYWSMGERYGATADIISEQGYKRPPLYGGKLKLDDESGITSVTPLDELVKMTVEIVDEVEFREGPGVCVALQAEAPTEQCPNMFAAFWSAYGSAAKRLIYDQTDEVSIPDVPEEAPDANYEARLRRIFADHLNHMSIVQAGS